MAADLASCSAQNLFAGGVEMKAEEEQMKSKRLLAAFMVLLAGLFLAARLLSSPASLAAGPPPTETPQVVEMPYPFSQDLITLPTVQPVKAVQARLDSPDISSFSVRPTTITINSASGWQKIMAQDFEGTFPPSNCFVDDTSSTDGGQYLWGKRNCRAHSGTYSIWAGGGGSAGQNKQCGDSYANNLRTWLICGPFDLSQATDAELQLDFWLDVEGDGVNLIDRVAWGASTNFTFHNHRTSGQTGDWTPYNMKLTDVPDLGNLTGQPAVYLDWLFTSDTFNLIPYQGAFADDVALWVYIPPPSPSPTLPVTLPITRHTTITDFLSGYSHDGTIVTTAQSDGALALAAQANTVGAWERLPSLPRPLIAFAAINAQGYLFVAGGNCPVDDVNPDCGVQRRVYSSPLTPNGRLGRWQETTPLPQALAGPGAAAANGHLFVVGGANALGAQKTVFSAPIHPDGSLGDWMALSQLPEPLTLPAVVAAYGYLYALGGQRANLSASDKVYRAAINADGTIGTWLLLPALLPVTQTSPPMSGLEGLVALAINDYLYIVGGDDGVRQCNGVFRARIRADGSLGPWEPSRHLPQTLSFHAGTVTRGGILITGGSSVSAGSAERKAAYWAAMQPDGNLGPWTDQPDLLYPMINHGLVASDAYAYNLGGRNTQGLLFSSVLAAPLQTATQVQVGHYNHQFELGRSYFIKQLRWQEIGNLGQVQIRYRVASPGSVYGPWSDFTSTQPVPINAIGVALEYQFLYQRQDSAANDKVISQVEIELSPLPSVYLPIVSKNQ
jgi:hypothetical protein